MKQQTFFTDPLVLSKEEMAMLLGISKSQWVMYTLGQRGLSLPARLKLEKIMDSATEVSFFKKAILPQETQQEAAKQEVLTALLETTIWKQSQLSRKLVAMEKKYEAALHTLHFIANKSIKKEAFSADLLKMFENKANKVLRANNLSNQEVLKIKLEVLHYQERQIKRSQQI